MNNYKILSLLCFFWVLSEKAISKDKAEKKPLFSLFYTEEELTKQNHAQKATSSPLVQHRLHLQALFYSGPGIWTFWINNCKISPSHPHPHYDIRRVDAESVHLFWSFEGEKHSVHLRPNQSYDAQKKQVREGSAS